MECEPGNTPALKHQVHRLIDGNKSSLHDQIIGIVRHEPVTGHGSQIDVERQEQQRLITARRA